MKSEVLDWIALSLVALSVVFVARSVYQNHLALPLAKWFLKRGKVGLAMRLHPMNRKNKETAKIQKTDKTSSCC